MVKSDIVVMLVDGDGGFEGVSGTGEGSVGVWGCSVVPGSPRGVATGVAAGSCDRVTSGFVLRRTGGGGRPSQSFSLSRQTSCSSMIFNLFVLLR